jgi:hypothetical protein
MPATDRGEKMNIVRKLPGAKPYLYMFAGVLLLAVLLVIPYDAAATFQTPSTATPYSLGQPPVPNAGVRAHWDSVFTQPAWWKKRNQPQQLQPPWDTTQPGYVR